MLSLSFLFSRRGLTWIAFSALLYVFLRDYPAWRASKQQNSERQESEQQASNENDKTPPLPPIEKVSLVHYILVSPFTVIYIASRVILDTIRYSLYYSLWFCEKAIPFVDDWLYDFCTVSLPKKYNQTEVWWIQSGRPRYIQLQHYTHNHIIPSTVNGIETFFVTAYHAACAVRCGMVDLKQAWERFVQRHNWHQLALDLLDIANRTCWVPLVWTVSRLFDLSYILYSGLSSTMTSLAQECQWLIVVVLPNTIQYIASTRLANGIYQAGYYAAQVVQQLCIYTNAYVLQPTIGRLLTWIVKLIDRIILLLQENTFHEKLIRWYRFLAPSVVWSLMELDCWITHLISGASLLNRELVVPAHQLFVKHVMPKLSMVYRTMVDYADQWAKLYLYPLWTQLYPYLNRPLYWTYLHVAVPIYAKMQDAFNALQGCLTQRLANQIWTGCSKSLEFMLFYAKLIYQIVQLWLNKQAPVLAEAMYRSFHWIKTISYWRVIANDLVVLANELYSFISNQSNMVYSSLERSLTDWAKDQQQTKDHLK